MAEGVNTRPSVSRKGKALLSVNAAVLLFGLAGLFSKVIELPALGITFGRVAFSSASLAIFLLLTGKSFRTESKKDTILLFLAGAVLAVHWWTFLASIKLSTVAIGTITFSAFPLFVTFLEPLVYHRRPSGKNILIAVVILIGVAVTVPELSFENTMVQGILTGVFSSFLYAVLAVMNKNFAGKYDGALTAFYEQFSAALVLLPFILRAGLRPSAKDLGFLLFFGVVTTAFAHTLFIGSLKEIPAQLAGVCSSMETVYGILLALLLLGEVPSFREILGAVIIVGAVVCAQLGAREEEQGRPGRQRHGR